MARVVLTVRVTEGDIEFLADIDELGLEIGGPSRKNVLSGLRTLVEAHCAAILSWPKGNLPTEVTEKHLLILTAISKLGFELRTEEMEPAKLAEALAKSPHVLEDGDGSGQLFWVSGHYPNPETDPKCANLGGRCAFRQTIMDWKALNEPTTEAMSKQNLRRAFKVPEVSGIGIQEGKGVVYLVKDSDEVRKRVQKLFPGHEIQFVAAGAARPQQ